MVTIYTIGHGRKSAWEVARMLDQAGVEKLVDVRTYPSSKRNPTVSRSRFERELGERYRWLGWALGGYKTESVKRNWSRGMDELVKLARESIVAIMCSEGLPEHCHRQSEIVPELYERLGVEVKIVHIMPDGALRQDRRPGPRLRQESLFD